MDRGAKKEEEGEEAAAAATATDGGGSPTDRTSNEIKASIYKARKNIRLSGA